MCLSFIHINNLSCSTKLNIPKKQTGFTLVEIIVGIVVLAVSLSIITRFVVPLTQQGADQVQQIKAAELAQSLMNEILAKAYDDNSDMAGGSLRCGETGMPACTTALGFEEANREDWDDVDDYNGFSVAGKDLENSAGQALGRDYYGFSVNVVVSYDGNFDGTTDNNQLAKLITIRVTTPAGQPFVFSSYKANF